MLCVSGKKCNIDHNGKLLNSTIAPPRQIRGYFHTTLEAKIYMIYHSNLAIKFEQTQDLTLIARRLSDA